MILNAGWADDSAGTSSESLLVGILLSGMGETMMLLVAESLSGDSL
jgi:hypothetical protein